MKKIKLTLSGFVCLGLLLVTDLMGQTNVNMPYNTGVFQTFTLVNPQNCTFFNFYDNGGPAANYSNSSNPLTSVVTFAPAVGGNKMRVSFASFATETTFDALYIYNGNVAETPNIVNAGVTTVLPNQFDSGSGIGATFRAGGFQGSSTPGPFTSTAASGALTFQFDSDFSVTFAGWSATIVELAVAACAMTAPANQNISTGQFNCLATATTALPTFNPGGCQASYTLRYAVDGGSPVVVPQPLPATISIPNLASGVHTVLWTLVDACFGAQVAQASQSITVSDMVPPVITCPANINITLAPGACDAIVGYNIGVTDNCPFFVQGPSYQLPASFVPHGGGTAFTLQGNNAAGGVYFNLTNTSGNPLSVTGFGIRYGNPAFGVVNPPKTMELRVTNGNTFQGVETNAGAWANVGPSTVTVIPPYFATGSGPLAQVVLTNPVQIAPGATKGFHIWGSNSCVVFNYNFGAMPPVSNGPWTMLGGPVSFGLLSNLFQAGAGSQPNIAVEAAIISDPTPTQTAGLPSGSVFPIGTTQNCFVVADVVGNTSTCCFNVTINEYPNPTTTLACNDNVQVSVNENCLAYVTTDMILEGGPYGCYDEYLVSIQGFGSGLGGVTINSSAVGQTLVVTVTDPSTGNSCWGTISVEDKIPPTIECRDVVIMCGAQLPDMPAPELSGYQTITYSGLNDGLDLPAGQNLIRNYNFNYNYLPVGTPVLDVDVRVNLTHTWTMDVVMELIAPNGFTNTIFQVGGCGGMFPINTIWDDEGVATGSCLDFDDVPRLQPFQLPGIAGQYLDDFDGLDASGTWTLRIRDQFPVLDGGTIFEVGLAIDVNLPQIDPADNCGNVTTSYTDTESGDPCEGLVVTRRWVVTDGSGNTASCDQHITVEPLVLDSVAFPPAYVGSCGQSDHPSNTGWPTVNGGPITDEDNICNIFVGYWDKPLNDCGNGVKIIRTWTVLDWCTQTTVEGIQVIKLTDNEPPILTCPANLTVGTDFWYCYANVSVPKPTVVDACGSSWTLSLASSAGIIVNFGNNYVINQLPLGTHTVTWTATDQCNNKSSCTFTIRVVDDVVPVANCDAHTVVSLTNDGPFGITLVPAHVFDDGSYDNCGPVTFRVRRMDSCIEFDWTTEGACVDDIPGGIPPVNSRDRGTVHRPCVPFACCDVGAGPVMVELEVTDAAGNRNYCMVEAIVQDKITPFVACPPDIIVSCDFWFNVVEGTFDDATGNNNGNLDEDPLTPIFGNMFDAFKYNDDESVRQNIVINDPGNTSPSYPQPYTWGRDGWADDNCKVNLQVRVRVIDDCSGDDLPSNHPPGAVKLIERRFSASDGNPGVAPGTCTQRIWVVDYKPFYITDVTCNNSNPQDGVIWPCDVLLTTCPEDLGNTGEPTVFDDACSLIGVTYTDTRFNFVDGSCFKILRKWSVIDWCQYNSQTGAGLWMYTQVIKVHDEEGPAFVLPCQTVTLCVADDGVDLPANNQAFVGEGAQGASSCSAHLNLSRVVHETCSDIVNYDVKIYPFNGTEFIVVKSTTTATVDENNDAILTFDTRQSTNQTIRLNGIPYNSQWCGDYHRILWSVEDGCGNWSHCEYLFRLEDCKQPSPVCINGLSTVVMPIGGAVTIWAKDFNASSFDDCTPASQLLYSFSGDSYQPSFTYTCDNVPVFGVEISVQIWVADNGTDDNCNGQISWAERNKDYCTTTIVIMDNQNVCDTSGSILAGEILTEDIQSVELVGVSINAPGHVFPTYVTTQNGQYNFNNVILPGAFSIHAERDDAHRNGVSTLDLVKIQKHLLGIELLNSPYDLIAADANNNQTVSAIDLVELRKLILGIYTKLPANKSWRFVDKNFQFADVTSPWPFNETIQLAGMSGNQMDKSFIAVKVGDVNNTVQANATQILPRNGNGVVNFVADDRAVSAGELVNVAITSGDFKGIEGYQFTLQTTGLEFKAVESGIVEMNDEHMGVFGSTLTASWHKVGGIEAASSDVLFTLQFQATTSGRLSEMMQINSKVTEAEAYNTSSDIKDLKLTFRGTSQEATFALYQNEPNPFKGNTVIGYDLPEGGMVTLTVFDVTGKVVVVKEQASVKGYNTISISNKDIPSVGVLYYRLDANEYTATKKMIMIE